MESFFHFPKAPTAIEMRRRVRQAISQHRHRVATTDRADIAKLMNTRGSGWDDSLWLITSELRFYRSINAAEHAHARGEHMDRWYIWPTAA